MRWVEVRDLQNKTRRVSVEHIAEIVFDDRDVIIHTTVGQFGIRREDFPAFERALNQEQTPPRQNLA